jgi:23S rRNA (uracil1939-C5)-methyltransferase
MPVDDPIRLTVASVAFGGAGVARHDGKVAFVPLTLPGEIIDANVVQSGSRFDRAELVRVIEASPHRVTPRCKYFGTCGGCAYQHANYEAQVAIKGAQILETLTRLGGITEPAPLAVIAAPAPFSYRNRITVHTQGGVTGFVSRLGGTIVEIDRCEIASDEVNAELSRFLSRQPQEGHRTLRARGDDRTFSQVNPAMAAQMTKYVAAQVPEGARLLIDLYCGTGSLAEACLGGEHRTVAIDWSEHNIRAAKISPLSDRIEFICEAADAGFERVMVASSAADRPCVVIVDPPREGMTGQMRKALVCHAPERVVYVSCDPATFARDVRELLERYEIRSIQPFDMFPQTAEVELVAVLDAKPGH